MLKKKAIGYAVFIGSKELQENTCVVKNLRTGEQSIIAAAEISSYLF